MDTENTLQIRSDDLEKFIISKSLPLCEIVWTSGLTLEELKMIDIFLGRINTYNPKQNSVKITKKELEKILGVKRIQNEALKKRLNNLLGLFSIRDKKGIVKIHLFSSSSTIRENEYGETEIYLKASDEATKYIFNIETIGYVKEKLKYVTQLSSMYSYSMYPYIIKQKHFHKKWEVEIEVLKNIICGANKETYKEYKYFNDLVLKPVQKEIETKTGLMYEYKPIKKYGKKYTHIEFTVIADNNVNEVNKEQHKESEDVNKTECKIIRFQTKIFDNLSPNSFLNLEGTIRCTTEQLLVSNPASQTYEKDIVEDTKKTNKLSVATKNIEEVIISKSYPLISVCERYFSLQEIQLIDLYLGKINPNNPKTKTVTIEKRELEKILGVKQIRTDVLRERLSNLLSPVEVPTKRNLKGFSLIYLFEKAYVDIDDNGFNKIELICSSLAEEYFFNIDKLDYIKIRIKWLMELSNKSAYTLYYFFRKSLKEKYNTVFVDFEELRKLLNKDMDTYKNYKFFNQKILSKCCKEINEKTNISVEYKKDRFSNEIEFHISLTIKD